MVAVWSLGLALMGCQSAVTPSEPAERVVEKPPVEKPPVVNRGAPIVRPPPPPTRVEGAQPMELAESRGPGGEPSETLNLVFASRGDGEIEPCG